MSTRRNRLKVKIALAILALYAVGLGWGYLRLPLAALNNLEGVRMSKPSASHPRG